MISRYTTSFLSLILAGALVASAQAAPSPVPSSGFGFGFGRSSSQKQSGSQDRKARKQGDADTRRSRSTGGFSWFGGQQSAKPKPGSRSTTAYPIVQRFANVTTVKVNGVQRPATIHHDVLEQSGGKSTQVVIDIASQRAYLLVEGKVGIDTPVSTAAAGMVTPTGTYSITEKVRSGKMSTIYHCAMPNWMRLGSTAIGMHTGYLPGYPASHGCVRLPGYVAAYIYDHTHTGTRVAIRSTWSGDCSNL